jgi:hypothetical protein
MVPGGTRRARRSLETPKNPLDLEKDFILLNPASRQIRINNHDRRKRLIRLNLGQNIVRAGHCLREGARIGPELVSKKTGSNSAIFALILPSLRSERIDELHDYK